MKHDDLKNLSAEQLQDLVIHAQKLLNKYEEDKRKKIIKEIQDLAASADLSVEIKPESKTPKGKTKGIIKFRNPEDPRETWTGRGKRPKWLTDKLDSGRHLEEFAV